ELSKINRTRYLEVLFPEALKFKREGDNFKVIYTPEESEETYTVHERAYGGGEGGELTETWKTYTSEEFHSLGFNVNGGGGSNRWGYSVSGPDKRILHAEKVGIERGDKLSDKAMMNNLSEEDESLIREISAYHYSHIIVYEDIPKLQEKGFVVSEQRPIAGKFSRISLYEWEN